MFSKFGISREGNICAQLAVIRLGLFALIHMCQNMLLKQCLASKATATFVTLKWFHIHVSYSMAFKCCIVIELSPTNITNKGTLTSMYTLMGNEASLELEGLPTLFTLM